MAYIDFDLELQKNIKKKRKRTNTYYNKYHLISSRNDSRNVIYKRRQKLYLIVLYKTVTNFHNFNRKQNQTKKKNQSHY